MENIKTNWKNIIQKYDFEKINNFLKNEKEKFKDWLEIYPPKELIFNCFNYFLSFFNYNC